MKTPRPSQRDELDSGIAGGRTRALYAALIALGLAVNAAPAAAQNAPATEKTPATTTPATSAAKPEIKKPEVKKTDAKKTEPAKATAKTDKKPEPKKAEAKKPESKKPDAKKDAKKYEPPKVTGTAKKEPAKPASHPAPAAARAPTPMQLAPPPTAARTTPELRPSVSGGAPAMGAAAPSIAAPAPTSPAQDRQPLAEASGPPPSESDMAAVKRVIEVMRTGNRAEALRLSDAITEPLSRKLAEWIVLRFDDNFIGFQRYANFVNANPTWPSVSTFRRRAEATLWQEKADTATVKAYFATNDPLTAKGRLALARALLASGDSNGAQTQVREAWHSESMSADMEAQVRDQFGPFINAGDDKARMEERLYANDTAAGLRAAQRLNNAQLAIARARAAVTSKAGNARALVNAVPHEAHNDPGYLFAHVQMLRREDKFAEAARVMAGVTKDPAQLRNTDEWWIERRLLSRKLLDVNDAKAAYVVARDAPTPEKEVYRIEREFTAGWIALRFLHDHQTAIAHFAKIPQVTANPISLARAGYWLGRALETAGRPQDARRQYEAAARWTTAYYGQMARAKLGLSEMVLYAPQASSSQRASVERLELVRAAEILYALDEPNLIRPLMADLGERLEDIGALTALGEIAARQKDARSMVLLGKAALARGYPFGQYAFPTVGVPDYTPVGPKIDQAIVFSIMRQESGFDPKIVSPAKAMGLMQVTPVAGKDTCKRFKCSFDANRLLNDPTYNLQIGSAELAGVLSDYRGSYILTFAAYNAGRGSVREWLSRYGDPRDPGVDPIDWVERIPFSETRNYVQRVMENLQVYRVRFGGTSKLLIEADLKRGGETN